MATHRSPLHQFLNASLCSLLLGAGCQSTDQLLGQTAREERQISRQREELLAALEALPPPAAASAPAGNPAENISLGQQEIAGWYADRQPLRLARAKTHFNEALRAAPGHAKAHHGLAIVADLEANFPEAERNYLAALEKSPRESSILGDLGYSYLLQERFADAERFSQQAIVADPNNRKAVKHLADAYARQGKAEQARATYARVLPAELVEKTLAENAPRARANETPVVRQTMLDRIIPGPSQGERLAAQMQEQLAARDRQRPVVPPSLENAALASGLAGANPPRPLTAEQVQQQLAAIDAEQYRNVAGGPLVIDAQTGLTSRLPGADLQSLDGHGVQFPNLTVNANSPAPGRDPGQPGQYDSRLSMSPPAGPAAHAPEYFHAEQMPAYLDNDPRRMPGGPAHSAAYAQQPQLSQHDPRAEQANGQFAAANFAGQPHVPPAALGNAPPPGWNDPRQEYAPGVPPTGNATASYENRLSANDQYPIPRIQPQAVQAGGANSPGPEAYRRNLEPPRQGMPGQGMPGQGMAGQGMPGQYDARGPVAQIPPQLSNALNAGDNQNPRRLSGPQPGQNPIPLPPGPGPGDPYQDASRDAARMGMGLAPHNLQQQQNLQNGPPGQNVQSSGYPPAQPDRNLPTDMPPRDLSQAYNQNPQLIGAPAVSQGGPRPAPNLQLNLPEQYGNRDRYDPQTFNELGVQQPMFSDPRMQQYEAMRWEAGQQRQQAVENIWNQGPMNSQTSPSAGSIWTYPQQLGQAPGYTPNGPQSLQGPFQAQWPSSQPNQPPSGSQFPNGPANPPVERSQADLRSGPNPNGRDAAGNDPNVQANANQPGQPHAPPAGQPNAPASGQSNPYSAQYAPQRFGDGVVVPEPWVPNRQSVPNSPPANQYRASSGGGQQGYQGLPLIRPGTR